MHKIISLFLGALIILGFPSAAHAFSFSASGDQRTEIIENHLIDQAGTPSAHAGLHNYPRLRAGLSHNAPLWGDALELKLETEHDLELMDFSSNNINWRPRSLYAALAWNKAFQLRLGLMTSHWGMGLLAHNGLTNKKTQTDLFSDPRSGDRMLRSMAIIPIPAAKSAIVLAGDLLTSLQLGENGPHVVLGDDILLPGDNAQQIVGAWKTNLGDAFQGGLYGVHRWQQSPDGGYLEITVADLYVSTQMKLTEHWSLKAESETATVLGITDLGSTPTFPEHDVLQLGSALSISLKSQSLGFVLDGLWASGDQNFDDNTQNGFKTDINFNQGLLLHNRLLTDISIQSVVTASNLSLTGVPSEDLNRYPNRGSITNTKSLFPKIWYKPIRDLKVYGGALLAWTDVALTDPFQTKMAGGIPANAYQGAPGNWLGLEIDLGLQHHFAFSDWGGMDIGLEAAWLQPGDAFVNASGDSLNTIMGSRAFVSFQL
jgi:hypothetical protein